MKSGIIILSILLLGVKVFSQESDNLLASFTSYVDPFSGQQTLESADEIDLFLSTSEIKNHESLSEYKSSLEKFTEKQRHKKSRIKNEKYFLKNLFYKVHNKYLKNYKNYVSFDEIFRKGDYDCVTGTALYAVILNDLGFDLQIYESNFHVFLLINLSDGRVLIEATDFYTGYVDNEEQISSRIAHYQLDNTQQSSDFYTYQKNNDHYINPRQLAGLLYFNLAVEQYNGQNFKEALHYLKKAESLYQSHRTSELKNLINKMIFASNSFSFKD